jgi:hypothetical protein
MADGRAKAASMTITELAGRRNSARKKPRGLIPEISAIGPTNSGKRAISMGRDLLALVKHPWMLASTP